MDYSEFFSKNLPAAVEMPAGLRADTAHIFSVTNAVPQAIDGALYAEAMSSVLLREATSLAGYPGLKGHEGLRGVIADELKDKRSADVDIDDIFISDGAGGAIRKLVDAFIDAGDVVIAEEFTYSGTLNMLLSKRAEVIHVNSDMDGMDTEALEAEIKRLAARGRKPKFIYTIPVYQNPTGATLSLERRKHMLRIAAEYNIPIVENESYADFRIDGDPLPPSMLGMDDSGLVIYVSSYTKLLGCGLRVGFAVASQQVQDVLTGGMPSQLATMLVYEYLRTRKAQHVETVRRELLSRRDALVSAVRENFPSECEIVAPHGGMMGWVRMPEDADTWAALDSAVEAGVKYNPGGIYRADRARNNHLRMTFSHNTAEEIREGVATLAGVFERRGMFG
ncbi:MAG: PLP-dependent aminotransferase family protein [Chloroflexota bacterium]|nr:PLP-dependent aminotransferase family protein [Chloroflexota bacterium]